MPVLPSRPKSRIPHILWRTFKITVLVGIVGAIGGGGALFLVVKHLEQSLPSTTDLGGNYHPPQVTRILARDGTLMAELFTERRTVISIRAIPAHVKLAVLAAEDAEFYVHEGLNYWGIARAVLVNLKSGRKRQGGSTITQQVVKNLLLDPERTYKRKLREALLARRIEQELPKDAILELYLNHIYFGRGRYGIEEAARDNFGKSASNITIAEGALLAGLVAGPEVYSPRRDLKKAIARRTFVLGQMRDKGFLNDAQYEAAQSEPVRLAPPVQAESELGPEVVEIVRRMLNELEPERGKRGGFTIATTLDPRLQAAARKAVRDNLEAYDKRHGLVGPLRAPSSADRPASRRPLVDKDPIFEGTPTFEAHKILMGVVTGTDDTRGTVEVRLGTVRGSINLSDYPRYNPARLPPSVYAPLGAKVRVSLLAPPPEAPVDGDEGHAIANAQVPLRLELGPEGAFAAIDVRTRHVLALIGNYEAVSGGLDRATQARRQPGSAFKPFVYSYALHSHLFTPATRVDVRPEVFEGGYKPRNYEGWTGLDPVRLREALARSINLVAVRVLAAVGPQNVVEWSHALGIRSVLKPDLSLALGSYEVKLLELAGAYTTFAAGGVYEECRLVTRIVGPDGKEIPLKPLAPPVRVMSEAEAYLITSMMTSVIDHGTGVRAKQLGRPLAGKSGTSNLAKDAWFAGYSTDIAAVAWVGYDDAKSLGSETGSSAALPAWIQWMKAAHEQKPPTEFPMPPGVETATIDKTTGGLTLADDTNTLEEVFLTGTAPTVIEPEDASAPTPLTESVPPEAPEVETP